MCRRMVVCRRIISTGYCGVFERLRALNVMYKTEAIMNFSFHHIKCRQDKEKHVLDLCSKHFGTYPLERAGLFAYFVRLLVNAN